VGGGRAAGRDRAERRYRRVGQAAGPDQDAAPEEITLAGVHAVGQWLGRPLGTAWRQGRRRRGTADRDAELLAAWFAEHGTERYAVDHRHALVER
jgi:hypothetical protein